MLVVEGIRTNVPLVENINNCGSLSQLLLLSSSISFFPSSSSVITVSSMQPLLNLFLQVITSFSLSLRLDDDLTLFSSAESETGLLSYLRIIPREFKMSSCSRARCGAIMALEKLIINVSACWGAACCLTGPLSYLRIIPKELKQSSRSGTECEITVAMEGCSTMSCLWGAAQLFTH